MKNIYATMILAALITVSSAEGGIIHLRDGLILPGEVKSADSSGIVINTLAGTSVVSQNDLLKVNKNITDSVATKLEVTLKDGSVIKGTISNYDEEIGVLINTDFGKITLPPGGIKHIYDRSQRDLFYGLPLIVGAGGGYYFPQGDFKKSFANQPIVDVFAEYNSRLVRGLYFGASAGYVFMDYIPETEKTFNGYRASAIVTYRYMSLRTSSSRLLRLFAPMAGAGLGFTYITLDDGRQSAEISDRSEMDPTYSVMLGLEMYLTDELIIRPWGGWMGIQQKSGVMSTYQAGLAAAYGI